ncbi:MAG: 5'/3'-nucleotidase SurE [Selenomonadaceae bacterium]|nr:5'/3'-nucleotidase SurE [Selenomonadaceae bacterium]
MRILLANDDGIAAEGLRELAAVLSAEHEIFVCAPKGEQSGMAHALSVRRPMEFAAYAPLEKTCVAAWSLDGTPTDCVKVCLESVLKENPPDLVISGINRGANLATDVLYSGTVGAAMEGYLHGITSLAVSLDKNSALSYRETAGIFADFLRRELATREQPFFYNVNFPPKLAPGVPQFVFATLGKRDYINAFLRHTDEEGKEFFTVGGEAIDLDKSEGTDIYAVDRGYIAVTPLHTELTDFAALGRLR